MKIFAYGSNMNINRLRERVPSATKIINGSLAGYKFAFNKISTDGSGKGNIQRSDDPNDMVWGVIFQIKESEKSLLDDAERGYTDNILNLMDEDGKTVEAHTYIANANRINNDLLPYDWYKAFVVTGATQNHLPLEYIGKLKAFPFNTDPDIERMQGQLAILTKMT